MSSLDISTSPSKYTRVIFNSSGGNEIQNLSLFLSLINNVLKILFLHSARSSGLDCSIRVNGTQHEDPYFLQCVGIIVLLVSQSISKLSKMRIMLNCTRFST